MNAPDQFSEAIVALGKTDSERAAILGVSRITVIEYRKGNYPSIIHMLKKHPSLAAAVKQMSDDEAAQSTDAEAA